MPRHTHRHKPACVQVHWRQAHGCHPISGQGGKRGARWKAFECDILAGTIFSPPLAAAHSLAAPHSACNTGGPGHENTFPKFNHITLCTTMECFRGTSEMLWGLVPNTPTLALTSTGAGLRKCVLLQSSAHSLVHGREQQCQWDWISLPWL